MTYQQAIKALEEGKRIVIHDGDPMWQIYPDPRHIGRYRVDDLRDPARQWYEITCPNLSSAMKYVCGEATDFIFEEKRK